MGRTHELLAQGSGEKHLSFTPMNGDYIGRSCSAQAFSCAAQVGRLEIRT